MGKIKNWFKNRDILDSVVIEVYSSSEINLVSLSVKTLIAERNFIGHRMILEFRYGGYKIIIKFKGIDLLIIRICE